MIFESPNELPREVMLEMTLNSFGFDMDFIEVQSPIKVRYLLDVLGMNAMFFSCFQIGMEGKGFEPIVEALFGEDGFFPDTVMKTTLYATDNMPAQLIEVLENMLPIMRNERKKRQVLNVVKIAIGHISSLQDSNLNLLCAVGYSKHSQRNQ